MPEEYIPWFRMKVEDLPPREYWATSVEDMGIATALQAARHRGEERAEREAREETERKRQADDRERKVKELQKRLEERAGC